MERVNGAVRHIRTGHRACNEVHNLPKHLLTGFHNPNSTACKYTKAHPWYREGCETGHYLDSLSAVPLRVHARRRSCLRTLTCALADLPAYPGPLGWQQAVTMLAVNMGSFMSESMFLTT